MGLFGKGNSPRSSVAIIDIDSVSVGGALAHYDANTQPTICYTVRMPITRHGEEAPLAAMLRSLDECARELVEKGAPVLRREIGSGHLDKIVVRVGSPLQQTIIRRERVEDSKPFIFTKAIAHDAVRKGTPLPDTQQSSEETIVATLLNGYETSDPYGKHAKFAELIILSSSLEKEAASGIQKVLRAVYHTHALTVTAFASVSYKVFKKLFPHEKNFLVLKITGEATEMIFIKGGTLVKVSSLDQGTNTILRQAHQSAVRADSSTSAVSTESPAALSPNLTQAAYDSSSLTQNPLDPAQNLRFSKSVETAEAEWLKNMEGQLREFATEQALPRTIFLVTSEDSREYFTRLLDATSLKTLWLSDDPLRVIGISQNNLTSYVTFGPEAEPDVFLSLLALFASGE